MFGRKLIYVFGLTIFMFACSDPCEDWVCVNGIEDEIDRKTCECICDEWYEGELCENEIRAKYIGTYSGSEDCGSGNNFNTTYEVNTANLIDVSKIRIHGIFVPDVSVTATISDEDHSSFEIPEQTSGNYTVSGSGQFIVVNGVTESMELEFTISTGSNTDSCTTTKTKNL